MPYYDVCINLYCVINLFSYIFTTDHCAVEDGELQTLQRSFAKFSKQGMMPRETFFTCVFADVLPRQYWAVGPITHSQMETLSIA
jgi:hypothetical protein